MSYNESEWPEVKLTIEPSGKAPKKYGEGVLRFSAALTLSVIMPRRGWQLIKSTKNYVYLKPPVDLLGRSPAIDIKIPTRHQAEEIAKQCYVAGESWMGQIGEWPAWYFHERNRDMQEITPNSEGGYTTRPLDGGAPVSSLHLGEYGVWSVALETTDGVFSCRETGRYEQSEVALVEGEASEVVLNKYERSRSAREACVQHHGYSCAICGFNFESVYGEIGRGFIHIHHIAPISGRGGEYQVDPVRDLIPVCPNCHAMVHRRTPPMSITELQVVLSSKKSNQGLQPTGFPLPLQTVG